MSEACRGSTDAIEPRDEDQEKDVCDGRGKSGMHRGRGLSEAGRGRDGEAMVGRELGLCTTSGGLGGTTEMADLTDSQVQPRSPEVAPNQVKKNPQASRTLRRLLSHSVSAYSAVPHLSEPGGSGLVGGTTTRG